MSGSAPRACNRPGVVPVGPGAEERGRRGVVGNPQHRNRVARFMGKLALHTRPNPPTLTEPRSTEPDRSSKNHLFLSPKAGASALGCPFLKGCLWPSFYIPFPEGLPRPRFYTSHHRIYRTTRRPAGSGTAAFSRQHAASATGSSHPRNRTSKR